MRQTMVTECTPQYRGGEERKTRNHLKKKKVLGYRFVVDFVPYAIMSLRLEPAQLYKCVRVRKDKQRRAIVSVVFVQKKK